MLLIVENLVRKVYSINSRSGDLQLSRLPEGLIELGESAFNNAGSEVKLQDTDEVRILPPGLQVLPRRCFFRCGNVQLTEFGSEGTTYKLHTIGESALDMLTVTATGTDHHGVTIVNLYPSITSVGNKAFAGYGSYDGMPGGTEAIIAPRANPLDVSSAGFANVIGNAIWDEE